MREYLWKSFHLSHMYHFFCTYLLLVGMYLSHQAQDIASSVPFILPHPDSTLIIPINQLYIWEDTTASHDLEEARKRLTEFVPYSSLTRLPEPQSAIWCHFKVTAQASENQDWMLYLNHPQLSHPDYSDVYLINPDGQIIHKQSGQLRDARVKDIRVGAQECIGFTLQAADTIDVWIRNIQKGPQRPFVYAELSSRDTWGFRTYEFIYNDTLGNITFVAILLVMVLYHLMIFFATWDFSYLYYSLYVLSLSLAVVFDSIAKHYSWGYPQVNQFLAITFLMCISIFYYQFARSFLQTATLTPKWDKWIRYLISLKIFATTGLVVYLAFTFDRATVYQILQLFVGLDIPILSAFFWSLYKTRSRLARYFIAGSAVIFIMGFSIFLLYNFWEINTFIPFFLSFILHIMIFSLGLGYRMRVNEREKLHAQQDKLNAQRILNEKLAKVNAAMMRFVPYEFIHSLGRKHVEDIQLGDSVEKESVTVLFCDIRSYTTMAEQMTLQENFQFLNQYLGQVGPVIKTHGGFVNQYFGDGIMAIFLNSADEAISAAMDIHKKINHHNANRQKVAQAPIRIGIGIHTGPLMMGIIGDHLRVEAGVVSDTVNTTARMEGLTKHYGNYTLVSEYTLLAMKSPLQYQYRFLGRVQVKGRQEPIGVYDFFEGDPAFSIKAKQVSLTFFEKGLKHYYYRDFHQAIQCFETVIDQHPEDLAAQRYHYACLQYLQEGIREDWQGVEAVGKY